MFFGPGSNLKPNLDLSKTVWTCPKQLGNVQHSFGPIINTYVEEQCLVFLWVQNNFGTSKSFCSSTNRFGQA